MQNSESNLLKNKPNTGCVVMTIYGACDLKKSLCEASCLMQIDDCDDKRVGTTMQTCRGGQVAWNQCFEVCSIVLFDKEILLFMY